MLEGIFIFLMLLDLFEFKNWIIGCGIELMEVVEECMEIVKKEIEMMVFYDYVVVNDVVVNVV